jgi:two-component system, cell cycle sensor histidine kinase and response regulator CckA
LQNRNSKLNPDEPGKAIEASGITPIGGIASAILVPGAPAVHGPRPVASDPANTPQPGNHFSDGEDGERGGTELDLRNSEARYRRLFEAAQDGILILDANSGRITDVNPFLLALLEYSQEELMGKPLWELGFLKDLLASKSAFRQLQENRYVRYENLPLETKSGRSINVEFVSNVYGVNDKKVIQCNIRDITVRKRAEQTEQQLRQTQKMEAVGQLAGGMAHDFNNLLGVILGYCEILSKQTDLSPSTREMIAHIHSAGTSSKDLTRHLLAFSRKQALEPVFLNLNEVVGRSEAMMSRLIGDDIELICQLDAHLGTINADPSQLEQVLMNLVLNARDAMPGGGKIGIKTTNVDINEAYALDHVYIKPGRYVKLAVSDTGVGMNRETQVRIFEPFFSTKEVGKGTGLGLATVFGIIKQSAGCINVYSEPAHGTTFKVYFPRCEQEPSAIPLEKVDPIRGGTETILLVDDAGPLRGLTRLLLEGCGYTVIDSGVPEEGLRIAQQYVGTLPLLITDVVMPGMSGPVLAEKLAAARSEIKVLYTSGYDNDEVARHGVKGANYSFLEKPYSRDDLARKVRELLDKPTWLAP